jgi:hypothetical protein
MASLERMICNGSFLKDISKKNHFNKCLNRYSDYGTCDHEKWVHYFNVMPHTLVENDHFAIRPCDLFLVANDICN